MTNFSAAYLLGEMPKSWAYCPRVSLCAKLMLSTASRNTQVPTLPQRLEILTPDEMAACDRGAIERGPFDGRGLMRRAGAAVAAVMLERFADARRVDVLCGPGNNGGDGYVVAEILRLSGVDVSVFSDGPPREGGDAALAASECALWPQPLAAFSPGKGSVVVDALYGAGLLRPLAANVQRAVGLVNAAGVPVIAVDLPSGVSGATGQVLGAAFRAEVTVTFVRKKPGHLLLPGKLLCGELIVADIGVSERIVAEAGVQCFENGPDLWRHNLPTPAIDAHKYSRGHVAVFSGGATATGAARLAAHAAARAGAGAVTAAVASRGARGQLRAYDFDYGAQSAIQSMKRWPSSPNGGLRRLFTVPACRQSPKLGCGCLNCLIALHRRRLRLSMRVR